MALLALLITKNVGFLFEVSSNIDFETALLHAFSSVQNELIPQLIVGACEVIVGVLIYAHRAGDKERSHIVRAINVSTDQSTSIIT